MSVEQLKFEVSETVRVLLPEEKWRSLVQKFVQLDSNQDGRISIDEFLNFSLTERQKHLTKKFATVDTDKDGFVEFEEFVVAIEPTFQILKKFRELDLDRNGLLSIEEALNIVDRFSLPLSSKQVQTIMNEADRDRDGQIAYYEFLGAIAHIGFQ